jgi:hypothetical protein
VLGGEIVWSGYEGEVWGDEYCGGRTVADGDGEFVSEWESEVAGMSTVLVGELGVRILEEPSLINAPLKQISENEIRVR